MRRNRLVDERLLPFCCHELGVAASLAYLRHAPDSAGRTQCPRFSMRLPEQAGRAQQTGVWVSATTSKPSHPVSLLAVFGYTALLGVLTAGTLATVQVLSHTIDPVLAVAFSAYALLLAVPVGLVTAFLSLGVAFGLRRISLRVTRSRTVASVAGGIGVVAVGGAVTSLLTHELLRDLQPIGWLALMGSLLGGAAFALWSRLCSDRAA